MLKKSRKSFKSFQKKESKRIFETMSYRMESADIDHSVTATDK